MKNMNKVLTSAPNRTSFPVAKPRLAAVRREADIFDENFGEMDERERERREKREERREREDGDKSFLPLRSD